MIEHFIKIKSNAIGFVEIHPMFVKALLPKLLPHFCYIFNYIIRTSEFPASWKKAKIIPIPKSSNEYRPIAILPFLSKVFESILIIILARTPEIGQGLGRILSCGARKPEQPYMDL